MSVLYFDLTKAGKSDKGFTQILVIRDGFSGALILAALQDRSGPSVCRAFLNSVIYQHGAPTALMSDCDKGLMGSLMTALTKEFGISQITTMGYNSRSNGAAESGVRFVNRCMRALTDEAYDRWEDFLPAFAFAHNVAARGENRVSPFEILRGLPARLPGSSKLTTQQAEDLRIERLPQPEHPNLFAKALKKCHQICQAIALIERNFTRQLQAEALNNAGSAREFQVDDEILFFRECVTPVDNRRARHSPTYFKGVVLEKLSRSG